MRALHLRTAAILMAAGVGLGGCASYSPFGYGNGVSVGYGNGYGYDPYYSGYGSRYGASYAPYGWYDGYYYPGAGYYVDDRYRTPYYWIDYQRRYWTVRQKDPSVREVWTDFARRHATRSGTTSQVQTSATTSRSERIRTSRVERAERRSEPKSSMTDRIRSRAADQRRGNAKEE
jgi:hypothetical protein